MRKSSSMQPGDHWPDYCTHNDGNEKNENDLVKTIEKPETKNDKNQSKGCANNLPEFPISQLRKRLDDLVFYWMHLGKFAVMGDGRLVGIQGLVYCHFCVLVLQNTYYSLVRV